MQMKGTAEEKLWDLDASNFAAWEGPKGKGRGCRFLRTTVRASKGLMMKSIIGRIVNTEELYALVVNHLKICESAKNQRLFQA